MERLLALMELACWAKVVKTELWVQLVQPTLSLSACSVSRTRQTAAEALVYSARRGAMMQPRVCLPMWPQETLSWAELAKLKFLFSEWTAVAPFSLTADSGLFGPDL